MWESFGRCSSTATQLIMYPVLSRCPICNHEMIVTSLHCDACDTTVKGYFQLNSFARLTPEQLAFVELFVRAEGKLNRVGQELELSYSAVRARLDEVIKALGYAVQDAAPQPITAEQRDEILQMVASGEISAEEAVTLLKQ